MFSIKVLFHLELIGWRTIQGDYTDLIPRALHGTEVPGGAIGFRQFNLG
jgi:hypothetical protein